MARQQSPRDNTLTQLGQHRALQAVPEDDISNSFSREALLNGGRGAESQSTSYETCTVDLASSATTIAHSEYICHTTENFKSQTAINRASVLPEVQTSSENNQEQSLCAPPTDLEGLETRL